MFSWTGWSGDSVRVLHMLHAEYCSSTTTFVGAAGRLFLSQLDETDDQ